MSTSKQLREQTAATLLDTLDADQLAQETPALPKAPELAPPSVEVGPGAAPAPELAPPSVEVAPGAAPAPDVAPAPAQPEVPSVDRVSPPDPKAEPDVGVDPPTAVP